MPSLLFLVSADNHLLSGEILIRDCGYNDSTIPHAMNYVNYDKEIVVKYGVHLTGWTHDKFENPGNIKTGLGLNMLLSALAHGLCYWQTLSMEEWGAKKHAQVLLEEARAAKKRKKRSDAGKSKVQWTATGKKKERADANRPRTRKRQKTGKSVPAVRNNSHEEDKEEDEEDVIDDDKRSDVNCPQTRKKTGKSVPTMQSNGDEEDENDEDVIDDNNDNDK